MAIDCRSDSHTFITVLFFVSNKNCNRRYILNVGWDVIVELNFKGNITNGTILDTVVISILIMRKNVQR